MISSCISIIISMIISTIFRLHALRPAAADDQEARCMILVWYRITLYDISIIDRCMIIVSSIGVWYCMILVSYIRHRVWLFVSLLGWTTRRLGTSVHGSSSYVAAGQAIMLLYKVYVLLMYRIIIYEYSSIYIYICNMYMYVYIYICTYIGIEVVTIV